MAKPTDTPAEPQATLSPFWAVWRAGLDSALSAAQLSAGPARKAATEGAPISVRDGVGVVRVMGVLAKRSSFFSEMLGATSYLRIRQALNAALADKAVEEIMLVVDSPGGDVEGMAELGDFIRAARVEKPITAFVDGLGASAAYYLASQASDVVASRGATVGSVGIITYLYDESELFAKLGVKPVVIATGEMKSTGVPGTKVTKAQQADIQRMVDFHFADFKNAVVQGRGMDAKAVEKIATGEVWPAPEAVKLGLVDRLGTFEDTFAALAGRVQANARTRGRRARFRNGR